MAKTDIQRLERSRIFDELNGFQSGVQLATDPNKLKVTQVRKINNMTLDEIGTATKRLGCLVLGTVGAAGARVISHHVFQRTGQTTQILAHLSDGTLRWSSDLVNWTTIASGLSTSAPFSFVTFLDQVWMCNGVDDYRTWTGAAQTTYAAVPKFAYIEEWQDTLWGANDSTNHHRVWSCDVGDPTTWPALNYVDVGKGKGVGITGLASTPTALVVMKFLQVHAIFDPVEYTNRVVDPDKGCLGAQSIVTLGGNIYFISHLGVCQYLGDAPSQIVSGAIQPMFNDYVYDEANEKSFYGYTYQGRVGWSWPRTGIIDFQQIEYYPGYPDTPWVFHNYPTRIMFSIRNQNNAEEVYGFAESTNETLRVFHPTTYTDNGTAITGIIETGWLNFAQPNIRKYVDTVDFMSRGDYQVDFFVDFDEDTVVKTYNVSAGDKLDFQEIYTDLYCVHYMMRISDATSGHTVRQTPVGATLDSVNEGSFAIGNVTILGKAVGDMR